MSYIAGLDIGSAISKAVILKDGELLSFSINPSKGDFSRSAKNVLQDVLAKTGLAEKDLSSIGATGIGSSFISSSISKITEISCHSRGAHYLFPNIRTLFEVGNQSSRGMKITQQGKVADSVVGDKCAAGSGRILQIIAKVIKVNLEDMGTLSLESFNPVKFSTGCAVFLETEAISRVAEGYSKKDIVAGLHMTLASAITAMMQRIRIEDECVVAGGGAKDKGLVKMMESKLGRTLQVPDEPLITGAIGAALIAGERQG